MVENLADIFLGDGAGAVGAKAPPCYKVACSNIFVVLINNLSPKRNALYNFPVITLINSTMSIFNICI